MVWDTNHPVMWGFKNSHCKDPYQRTGIMESKRFFFVAHVGPYIGILDNLCFLWDGDHVFKNQIKFSISQIF